MFKLSLFICFIVLTFIVSIPAQSKKGDDDPVSKSAKSLIQNIRNSNDAQALRFLDGEAQARYLLGEYFYQAKPAQIKEFINLFQSLVAKIAFPRVRENFKNLESIIYESAEVHGNEARVDSTIFIKHPLKKQETKIRYSLVRTKANWKVFDIEVLGSSMLEDIRDTQVQPELRQGGIDGLLNKMRSENSKL